MKDLLMGKVNVFRVTGPNLTNAIATVGNDGSVCYTAK